MEFLAELIFELFLEGILALLGKFFPKRKASTIFMNILYAVVLLTDFFSFISIFFGIILLINEELAVRTVGWYMIIIPLVIIGAQVVLGIVIRKKAKRN